MEQKGFSFFVEIEYVNLPEFCSNCNMTDHCLSNCKRFIDEGAKGMTNGNQKRRVEEKDGEHPKVYKKVRWQVPRVIQSDRVATEVLDTHVEEVNLIVVCRVAHTE